MLRKIGIVLLIVGLLVGKAVVKHTFRQDSAAKVRPSNDPTNSLRDVQSLDAAVRAAEDPETKRRIRESLRKSSAPGDPKAF
jgi:hypothetical protein